MELKNILTLAMFSLAGMSNAAIESLEGNGYLAYSPLRPGSKEHSRILQFTSSPRNVDCHINYSPDSDMWRIELKEERYDCKNIRFPNSELESSGSNSIAAKVLPLIANALKNNQFRSVTSGDRSQDPASGTDDTRSLVLRFIAKFGEFDLNTLD